MVNGTQLTQSSFPTTIFSNHFNLLAQKCKLHIQRISWKKCGYTSKNILIHVVKEGETLTSISKLYRVPVLDIADANKDIVDVNLVFQGQHLNIPSAVSIFTQLCLSKEGKLFENQWPMTTLSSRIHSKQWNHVFTVPSSSHLQVAKTSGFFLLLVLMTAFCIRCIIQSKIAAKLRYEAANKSGLKSMRWKTLLSDSKDLDTVLDPEFEPNSDPLSDDQEHLHAYTKLEDDYQKFLSECGMSDSGYWRGGLPK